MLVRRLVPVALVLALLASVAMLPASGAFAGPGSVAARKGKAPKCKKGYKLVTVSKNGHKLKKCKKKGKKIPPAPCRAAATASCAIPAPDEHHLFDPPGKKLEGNDAKPFLEKYLANSTFTSCVAGWPNCNGFEDRYSHGPGSNFHKCILRPTSGSDIIVNDEYGLEGALVEADGSWTIVEVVYDYGHYPHYKWHVSTAGVVEGEYAYPGEPIEHIGPLQYVGHASDCSY